jgi:hypothetical protein
MRRRHPGYLPTVARFIAEDPVAPARNRVIEALHPPRRRPARGSRGVVHLVHGWPPWSRAGTETYARSLALRQAELRAVTVYARRSEAGPCREVGPDRRRHEALELLDGGVRVRLMANDFRQRDPLSRNALYNRALAADFGRLLDEARPELVHVHHLAGHAISLIGEITRRDIPFLYQVQDWWTLCARANLFHLERFLCGGPRLGVRRTAGASSSEPRECWPGRAAGTSFTASGRRTIRARTGATSAPRTWRFCCADMASCRDWSRGCRACGCGVSGRGCTWIGARRRARSPPTSRSPPPFRHSSTSFRPTSSWEFTVSPLSRFDEPD